MNTDRVGAEAVLPLRQGERQSPLSGNKEDGDSRHQAWQREMERAQMETWLGHGVIGHAPASTAGLVPFAIPAAASAAPSATSFEGEGSTAPLDSSATLTAGSSQAPDDVAQPAEMAGDLIEPGRYRAATAGDRHTASPAPRPEPSPSAAGVVSAETRTPVASPSNPRVPPANFNAAKLVHLLQRFGEVQPTITVGGVALDSEVPSSAEPVDVHGISRAATALGLAAARTSEPARGLVLASGVLAELLTRDSHAAGERLAPRAERAVQVQLRAQAMPAEPIRVHADWSEQGVRLWLGMDAAALESLGPIAMQLQAWLTAQGLRLRSMSCNGRVLIPDAPSGDNAVDGELGSVDPGAVPPNFTLRELP